MLRELSDPAAPFAAEMAVWDDDEIGELIDDTASAFSAARDNRPPEDGEAVDAT